MSNETLTLPSAENVERACEEFDSEINNPDPALSELFTHFPKNTELKHVLLKVASLNAFYSTWIRASTSYSQTDEKYMPTIHDIARHIVDRNVDEALSRGDEAVVTDIAEIKLGMKIRYCYSFATKYCSFHQPDRYTIFDSRVTKYLWQLKKAGGISKFKQQVLWNYPDLKKIIDELRLRYQLQDFSYKKIDKFLYLEGGKLLALGV
jgi:hypothetical protein